MTQTLRDLIASQDFDGYPTQTPSPFLCAQHLDASIYAEAAGRSRPGDFERFCALNEVDLVNILPNAPLKVRLLLLRLNGRPVATLWRSSETVDVTLNFLDEDSFRRLRSAWEEAKDMTPHQKHILADEVLDMPAPTPGALQFPIDPSGATPRLSAEGLAGWIESSGGLRKITSVPPLNHALGILQAKIAEDESLCASLTSKYADREPPAPMAGAIAEFSALLAERKSLEKQIVDRIVEIS